MNKSRYVQSLFMIFSVTLLLAQFNDTAVTACTATPPSMGPPPTIADRVKSADIVLLGTVKNVVDPQGFEQSAVVQVERYFKGSGAAQIQILGFGSSALCRSQVIAGDRLIFYVQQQADGTLYAHWLTAGGAVASPTDELIAEITTTLNLPPTTVTATQTDALTASANETATPESVPIAPFEPPSVKATDGPFLVWIYMLATITLTMAAAFWYQRRKKDRINDAN